MIEPKIRITPGAANFIEKMAITDITFDIIEMNLGGILGIVKEIAPFYETPEDASGYRFFKIGELTIFIHRKIEIFGPLVLKTEGLWTKQLVLTGIKPSFFNF